MNTDNMVYRNKKEKLKQKYKAITDADLSFNEGEE
jgi:hypothetical protein